MVGSATFFAILRRYDEQNTTGLPLGYSVRLRDDVLRLGQKPYLVFATQDLQAIEQVQAGQHVGVPRVFFHNFGFFGPTGALPVHLTEYAYQREKHERDPSLREFLNIFQHRVASLFYRAWADSQPHVGLLRTNRNLFSKAVGAMVGHGPAAWGREALADTTRLGLAAQFSNHTRHAEGLVKVVANVLGWPCQVEQFAGSWLHPEPDDKKAGLGLGMRLGRRVWCAQSKVRVVLGPVAYSDYVGLLRTPLARQRLFEACWAYLGLTTSCEYQASVYPEGVPPIRLGAKGGQAPALGQCMWLGRLQPGQPVRARFLLPESPNSIGA